MQIDKRLLEKAAALPENELKELIYGVVSAAGGSRFQARAAASNSDKLKKKLEEITQEDIENALAQLNAGQLEKVIALIKAQKLDDHG